MEWQPLLEGGAKDEALKLAQTIAEAVTHPPSAWAPEGADENFLAVTNACLGSGKAGIALFLTYLSRVEGGRPELEDAARRLIGESVGVAANFVMGPSLLGGFAGVAWSLLQLDRWEVVACDEGTYQPMDTVILEFLDRQPWPWHIDLINGLAGIAVYALDRWPHPFAREALGRVVLALESCATETEEGIGWFTSPRLLQPETLIHAPKGCYNVGMAHGTPGVIAALSGILPTGVETERCRRLLEGAVRWLLAQQLPDSGNFPNMAGPEVRVKPARVAWCYGAPGIASALWQASTALGDPALRERALSVLAWAAAQSPEASGVVDAPICHGASGLAHIFNRFHQATGDPQFGDAARQWFGRIPDYRVEGVGVVGFAARHSNPEAPELWMTEPGLLAGAAGIGAALAAAVSTEPPVWDRLFLLGSGL